MKEIKELRFEDLSTDQKLGMVMAGIIIHIHCEDKYETFEENLEFVLEDLPHIPRVIIGGISEGSVNACIDVLAGINEPKGVPTYNFKLK